MENQIPNSTDVSGLPKSQRVSAAKLASYLRDHMEAGHRLQQRDRVIWQKTHLILRGNHYFTSSGGVVRLIEKQPGQTFAYIPLLVPKMRWEIGRMGTNQLGVTVKARNASSPDGLMYEQRGQSILNSWKDEANLEAAYDSLCRKMMIYNLVGLYRFRDTFKKTITIRPIPGSELYPIPYDRGNSEWDQMDGLMWWSPVTRGWLEKEDELYERKYNKPRERPIAKLAGKFNSILSDQLMAAGRFGDGTSGDSYGKFDGAMVGRIWMRPSELYPHGVKAFMVEDEIVAIEVENTPQSVVMPANRLPVEPVWYHPTEGDFWGGDGFCGALIPAQLEANRQLSIIIDQTLKNRGWTFVNKDVVDVKDMFNSTTGVVPFSTIGGEQPMFEKLPMRLDGNVGAMLNLIQTVADTAAGHESGLVTGQAEGRIEGGPALNMLNANAQVGLQTVLGQVATSLRNTYRGVLDELRYVWPEDKIVQIVGPNNLGREIAIQRSQYPWSHQLRIEPTPLMPNGKITMINLLFQLRQMQSTSGGSDINELSSREFRKALSELGMAPPSMNYMTEAEQRIAQRINLLIGDGYQPSIPPASASDGRLILEDHRVAVAMLKDVVLHETFRLLGMPVQMALKAEMDFHRSYEQNMAQPDRFDDDIDMQDARASENTLEAIENDSTYDGIATYEGMPV